MSRLEKLARRLKGPSDETELANMFPPEKVAEIKKRELRRFKASQDKKWRNWFESVSR